MRRRDRLLFIPFVLFYFAFTLPAWAGLEICNDTAVRQSVSVAFQHEGEWQSEGWWQLEPHDCVAPLQDETDQRIYYYLAQSPGWIFAHDRIAFCTGGAAFSIRNTQDCEGLGLAKEYFAKIDVTKLPDQRQYLSMHSEHAQGFEGSAWDRPRRKPQRRPYSGEALFQNCMKSQTARQQHCTLIGGGRVFIVSNDGRTAPPLIAQMNQLTAGQPVAFSGDWVSHYETVVEFVLAEISEREPSAEEQLLFGMQGDWYSTTDPMDQFTILGSMRFNRYAGSQTAQEFLAVLPFCGEFLEDGPYLYSWDHQAGTGLCYALREVSPIELILSYLPGNIELRYRRSE